MYSPLHLPPINILPSLFAQDDEPVDLSDKQGIVDPADLKKDDPPPPSVSPSEPPPPEPAPDVPPFDVDIGGVDDANRPAQDN